MKLAFLSDPHLMWTTTSRADDVEATSLKKFEYVLNYCCDEGIVDLLITGDFVDSPRSWYFLPKLIDLICKYNIKCGISLYVVRGQHDSYMRVENDATILGVLNKTGLLTVLGSKATKIGMNNYVYGFHWRDNFKIDDIPVPVVLKGDRNRRNILVIHAPISTSMRPYSTISADQVLDKCPEYDFILCGDIHKRFIIRSGINKGRFIANTGPMMRKEASDEMMSHRPLFYIIHSHDRKMRAVNIPHRPAEKVLSKNFEAVYEMDKVLDQFIQVMKTKIILGGNRLIRDLFLEFAKENGVEREITNYIVGIMEKYDGKTSES